MIRVLVVADSGATMQSITAKLASVVGVEIAAYASGAAPLSAIVTATRPDVVLVDEMPYTDRGALRIAEAIVAAAEAAVVGLTERVEGGWAPDALRAGAAAVVPSAIEPAALALVLAEVMAERAPDRTSVPERGAA